MLDEPHSAIKEVPELVTGRTRFDVSYPVTDTARQLNVVRCKEIVEKRTNMQVVCNKRFLKSSVVSTFSFIFHYLNNTLLSINNFDVISD